MQFEWDKERAETNLKKHGVSFTEAETVFGDSLARIFDDEEHSLSERRNTPVPFSATGIKYHFQRRRKSSNASTALRRTPAEFALQLYYRERPIA